MLGCLIAVIIIFFWAKRRLIWGWKAKKFILEADDVHSKAYTAESEDERRKQRERFEQMATEAIKSKNVYINSRDVAETLLGYVKFTVMMAVEGKASDAGEASSWGDRVTELLQPMLYKGRIK